MTARTATIAGSPPLLALGLRGAPGEHITNAVLFNQSPPIIPVRTTAATVTASADGDIAVFDPGPAGVSPGVYRIDSSWGVGGQPVARSWHLDIRGPNAEAVTVALGFMIVLVACVAALRSYRQARRARTAPRTATPGEG